MSFLGICSTFSLYQHDPEVTHRGVHILLTFQSLIIVLINILLAENNNVRFALPCLQFGNKKITRC